MLHPVLEEAIDSLLVSWRHHDNIGRRTDDLATRAASRHQLDMHRSKVRRLRLGLHPEARELEEVALTTRCPSLDAAVFIRGNDFLEPGSFLCPCGAVVAGLNGGN
ncbi:MAG: hypothetical protein KJP22_02825 [Acidimicrobiia bacterium]|nr:hypothetical protein [Acidimicrobiia bacterium]NNF87017.1 hypothetical protein [Acidimicrobiia bacterium]NNJ47999.1 hypothetical protein [Acidimicrobiia bacterium]NNL14732.1 hypothetical protein [Acidimicrobiia bacterium]RZV46966.1 MAG: hypothetical protein EX267_02210 [Acidimicrobiia bacterium]